MSDPIATTAKTPEEIKAATAEAATRVQQRIAELRACAGKTYAPNAPDPRFPRRTLKVLDYAGVGTITGGKTVHLLRVESFKPGAIWNPPATEFLENHTEIKGKQE